MRRFLAVACTAAFGAALLSGCGGQSTYEQMCDAYYSAQQALMNGGGQQAEAVQLVKAEALARKASKEYGGQLGTDYADLADVTDNYLRDGSGLSMLAWADQYGRACHVGDGN
ncbi:hypothetical protein SAMN05421678_108249 [Actinopolymorpha cephalotaxi]|uniref:Lipoprotein n=1 Tax=Actinopolymorpha cephalotaxi TaxID=504797 RepID=A0A1I2UN91_9ACTN|nr:hypothetical protein [Actinopolymorpha cephalotaxi]NYH86663.1 hypothetical protein [Actinopolymorpha cephalotaxi]SFG78513.1 hypothetical protein SAMN05421678_108249 [Actinopolymorpha cephalotaxi]